jgi:hypothetical protein
MGHPSIAGKLRYAIFATRGMAGGAPKRAYRDTISLF